MGWAGGVSGAAAGLFNAIFCPAFAVLSLSGTGVRKWLYLRELFKVCAVVCCCGWLVCPAIVKAKTHAGVEPLSSPLR